MRVGLLVFAVFFTTASFVLAESPEPKGWRVDYRSMKKIATPAGKEIRDLLWELEYNPDDDMPEGVRFDLNSDGTDDYVFQSAKSLCGTGGCVYGFIDGTSNKRLGTVFGSPIIIKNHKINRYPVICRYTRLGGGSGGYGCYVFDGKEYTIVSSVSLSGESLDHLFMEIKTFPHLKSKAQKR